MHHIRSSNSFILFSDENEIILVDSRFQLLHSIRLLNENSYRPVQIWLFQHATFISSQNAVAIVQAIHGANGRLFLLFHSCSPEGLLAFLGEVETNIAVEVCLDPQFLNIELNHIVPFCRRLRSAPFLTQGISRHSVSYVSLRSSFPKTNLYRS